MADIQKARKEINEIDKKMAELFVKRMDAANEVFLYKKENGLPVLDVAREQELVAKNSELVENEVYKAYYIDFLKSVMDISKKYQYRLQNGIKIAYSGVEGAFAHIASNKIFPEAELVPYPDFKSAYDAVAEGECDSVVLPMENSFAGEVGNVMDIVFKGSLYINGIYNLAVSQNLLGVKGADKKNIKTVVSHIQALNQCMGYIKENGFETVEAGNTAYAAKLISEENDKTKAAIASAETADIYGLEILERNINKSNVNTTKFAVLSKVKLKSGNQNSVLMFTVSNNAGSLAKAINVIGKYGYNMTTLRSRPLKEHSWKYYFYVEIDGNTETELGKVMINELKECCDLLKVAGTFSENIKL